MLIADARKMPKVRSKRHHYRRGHYMMILMPSLYNVRDASSPRAIAAFQELLSGQNVAPRRSASIFRFRLTKALRYAAKERRWPSPH